MSIENEKEKYNKIYGNNLKYDNNQLYGTGGHGLKVIDYILNLNFSTILDIGCGRCTFGAELQKRGKKVSAVDISEKLIKSLNLPGIELSVCPHHNISFKGSFDLVTSFSVLEHMPEEYIIPSIEEIVRLTKKDAVVMVAWNEDKSFNMNLHMTIKNQDWWENKFKKYFKFMDIIKKVPNAVYYHLRKTL